MSRLRLSLWMATALFAITAFLAPLHAQPREFQIKSVFLFNFLQFVHWPDEAFPSPSAPIRIGVLGDDPFGPALEDAVRGETINGRPLVITRSRDVDVLRDCHLIYISNSEARRLESQLGKLDTLPILTVGETESFTRRGGVIAFYPDGRKIRFEINVAAARRRGLKLSSELLSLGRVVGAESVTQGGR